jgi:hypothetical protein
MSENIGSQEITVDQQREFIKKVISLSPLLGVPVETEDIASPEEISLGMPVYTLHMVCARTFLLDVGKVTVGLEGSASVNDFTETDASAADIGISASVVLSAETQDDHGDVLLEIKSYSVDSIGQDIESAELSPNYNEEISHWSKTEKSWKDIPRPSKQKYHDRQALVEEGVMSQAEATGLFVKDIQGERDIERAIGGEGDTFNVARFMTIMALLDRIDESTEWVE